MSPGQIAQSQMTDANSNELFDFKSQLVKHATNLPVNSLAQDHPHPRHPDRLHFFHSRALPIEHDPGQQLRGQGRIPGTIERYLVFFFHFVARMRQALREIAVIGEDQESLGLRVEPADIEEARELRGQKMENRVARVRIGAGGNEAGRFVENQVKFAFTAHQLAAHFDVVALAGLRAEVGANATVNRNAPICDEPVAMPPRSDTGGGEETVQAHGEEV